MIEKNILQIFGRKRLGLFIVMFGIFGIAVSLVIPNLIVPCCLVMAQAYSKMLFLLIPIFIIILIIGLYIFFRPEPEVKKIEKGSFGNILKKLTGDEKEILEKIIESEGSILQSVLVDKTKFTKVKVTRILDKLEGKGLIERKRRGMTNVVILKH